jgi:hypothetical protein
MTLKEIKLYNSIKKPVRRIGWNMLLFVVCFYSYTGTPQVWLTTLLIAWLVISLIFNLYYLLDREPRIVLDNEGIYDKAVHNGTIPWQVIKDAYGISVYSRRIICLTVDDGFKLVSGKRDVFKRLTLFTKSLGAKELNLSLQQMDVNEEKLAAFIMQMKAANDIERGQLLSVPPTF